MQPLQINNSNWLLDHEERLTKERVQSRVARGVARHRLHGDSVETGDNWIFAQDTYDTCSILHVSLKYGVSDKGTEQYVKIFKAVGVEADRTRALPKTRRTVRNRVVQGYDTSVYLKYEYTFPPGLPKEFKTAPFVVKKMTAVLEDLLEDPDLVQPGNFYFSDYSKPRPGEYTLTVPQRSHQQPVRFRSLSLATPVTAPPQPHCTARTVKSTLVRVGVQGRRALQNVSNVFTDGNTCVTQNF